MKTTTFRIKQDGTVIAEGDGYIGDECIKDAEKFFQALGGKAEVEPKAEFYYEEEAGVTICR